MALTDNPMSLVIKSDITVGASITKIQLPTTDTFLLRKTFHLGSGKIMTWTETIVIPWGVEVVKVFVYTDAPQNYGESTLKNSESQKVWGNNTGGRTTVYVGVTPNKPYDLLIEVINMKQTSAHIIEVSYSESTNSQTPAITDY